MFLNQSPHHDEKNLPYYLFGVSLFFMLSTALRFEGLPFGGGELLFMMLAVYLAVAYPLPSGSKLGVFYGYTAFVGATFAGFVYNHAVFQITNPSVSHTLIAYAFNLGILYSISILSTQIEKVWQLFYCLLSLGLLFVAFHVDGCWYAYQRFTGLCMNPNQLALALVPAPFIIIKLIQKAYYPRELGITFIAIILIMGYENLSKALYLSWAVAAVYLFCISLYRANSRQFKGMVVLMATALLALLLYNSHTLIESYYRYETTRDMTVRLSLIAGMLNVLQVSPWVGLGPGSFINLTDGTLTGQYELHNTWLEPLIQGGLIGEGVMLIGLGLLARALRQKNDIWLNMSFISLLVFGSFHSLLRQPLFWIILAWLSWQANACQDETLG